MLNIKDMHADPSWISTTCISTSMQKAIQSAANYNSASKYSFGALWMLFQCIVDTSHLFRAGVASRTGRTHVDALSRKKANSTPQSDSVESTSSCIVGLSSQPSQHSDFIHAAPSTQPRQGVSKRRLCGRNRLLLTLFVLS